MRLGLALGLALGLGLALALCLLCLLWPLPGPVEVACDPDGMYEVALYVCCPWVVSGPGWGILGVSVAQP